MAQIFIDIHNCGLFSILMMIVSYGIKRLMTRRNSEITVANPFAAGALDSVSQFFLTMLYAATIVIIMYIPVYIARFVFDVDFRIANFIIDANSLDKLPVILCKYLPMWFIFFVPNAIMNANTRFNDLPDWLTTIICSVTNFLALLVFLLIQFTALYGNAALVYPNNGTGAINGCTIVPSVGFSAFAARYIYKKTGNAWAAGATNAILLCILTFFQTYWTTDFAFAV